MKQDTKMNAALWAGILVGPAVWFLSMEANFALAPWACAYHWKPALYVISIIGLLITTAAGFLAWSQWNRLGRVMPGEGGSDVARSRAMALGGVALSAMFSLTIIAQAIPEILLAACE